MAARLVAEEPRDAQQDLLEIGRLVEDDDGAGPQRGPYRARSFEAQGHVELSAGHERARRAAEQHRLQSPSGVQATCDVDQRSQGGAHRDLVETRLADVTGQAEEACAGRLRRAGRRKRGAPSGDDVQDVDERLHVVDQRRLAEQTDLHRERRLVARFTALSLDRVEQCRLLSADVRSRPAPDLDVEIEKSSGAGLRDRAFNPMPRERVFATDKYITLLASCGESGDRHPFNHCERVMLHELPILEGPWL